MNDDSQNVALAALRSTSLFTDLPQPVLQDLASKAIRKDAASGTCLIVEGEPGDSLVILLSGELEVVRNAGDGEATLARSGPGAFFGEMALVDGAPRSATVRALSDSTVLEITREQFDRVLDSSPAACRALMRTILRRLKSTEAMLTNQEKLAALGRVAAGLAHELNNPASAVSRFSEHLADSFQEWSIAYRDLTRCASPATLERMETNVRKQLTSRHTASTVFTSLEQANLEDLLAAWSRSYGARSPWDAASNFREAGLNVEHLEALVEEIPLENRGAFLDWLSAETSIQATLGELRESATRLSEIVESVKEYSHLDRAALTTVDINRGLRSALTILDHKVGNVQVDLQLDPDLPHIDGWPGELNQVWTNLIDNALDAVDESGRLLIRSYHDSDSVFVEVTDTGPGISEDNLNRLFEPFFTTKEVGRGTGLGLHISHTIVVQHHRGWINVDSHPGRTSFTVRLPVSQTR